MDVRDTKLPPSVAGRDATVASIYGSFLSAALQNPHVIAVETWGLADKYSWLTQQAPRADSLPLRPLPFDSDLLPKLATTAIAGAFDGAPMRTA